MKFLIFSLWFLFLEASFSQSNLADNKYKTETIGFKNGNFVQISNLRGTVRTFCQEPSGYNHTQTFSCLSTESAPHSHDYFVHPNKNSTQVELTASHEDGSQKKKSSNFNSSTGQSKKLFNLTIQSLTQSPLLEPGLNTIEYVLKNKTETVESGSFTVEVSTAPDRICPFDVLYSQHYSCTNISKICSDYFWKNNYCK